MSVLRGLEAGKFKAEVAPRFGFRWRALPPAFGGCLPAGPSCSRGRKPWCPFLFFFEQSHHFYRITAPSFAVSFNLSLVPKVPMSCRVTVGLGLQHMDSGEAILPRYTSIQNTSSWGGTISVLPPRARLLHRQLHDRCPTNAYRIENTKKHVCAGRQSSVL